MIVALLYRRASGDQECREAAYSLQRVGTPELEESSQD
jgi:hypothetical protein